MFYDKFVSLCERKRVTPTRAAIDAGISKSLVTKWKNNGVQIPSPDVLMKLSAYFGVPVSDLIDDKLKEAPNLSEKDRRDIARDLEDLMAHLDSAGDLMFDGDPMSDEARDSIRSAMKLGLEAAKMKNKERFTPKKYRKE